ncbi:MULTISPECIES: PilZ domain-containing protein [Silvimonas]|uniref:PilZ domain-containing protein n=1 Tax=Silvimonas TaxID=300264 RepID=UPI0024B39C38|nr:MULTISPECIES: PilZ domain-containing protein [Silvimonas]MDR3429659.1 PilZ domain-containing protein [Silvimonas sp.]
MDAVSSYSRSPELDQGRAASCPARWRVAVLEESRKHLGRTVNVSLFGISVHGEHTMQPGSFNELYLEIPPQVPAAMGGQPLVLRFKARVIHTVHDSAARCFRIGMEFVDVDRAVETQLADELVRRYPAYARAIRM